MIQDTIIVTVSEEEWGLRLDCSTCGGTTEKGEPFGHWYHFSEGSDVEAIVCWRCIENGDVYEALRSRAERLENLAGVCRRLATATWELPTVDELKAEGARRNDAYLATPYADAGTPQPADEPLPF